MFEDPGKTAQLFYLSLLGLFVASFLLARYRGRLGQATQHAAIWVLIFLGAVLVIGFAGDLDRFLSGGPQQIDEDTIAISRQGDGHFHAVLEVNGTDIPFIVDTGATNIVLARQHAERAGIDTGALRFSIPTRTANGTIMSAAVRLDSLTLGAITERDVQATVNGGALDVSLLGMRYLDRFSGWRVEGDTLYLIR